MSGTRLYRGVHRPLRPVSQLFRTLAFRRGRDSTDEFARRSCFVVAPHPDDETLGCGATLARKRSAGTHVTVVIVTDGRHSSTSERMTPSQLAAVRRLEAAQACGLLGVPEEDLVFLGFEDGTLEDRHGPLRERLQGILLKNAPEEILVPALADRHPDHRAVSAVVRELVHDVETPARLYEYPIWYWSRYPWLHRPESLAGAIGYFLSDPIVQLLRPRPDLVRTEPYLDRKREALAAYESQTRSLTGEDDWWTLTDEFLRHFLGSHEIFFPIHERGTGAA